MTGPTNSPFKEQFGGAYADMAAHATTQGTRRLSVAHRDFSEFQWEVPPNDFGCLAWHRDSLYDPPSGGKCVTETTVVSRHAPEFRCKAGQWDLQRSITPQSWAKTVYTKESTSFNGDNLINISSSRSHLAEVVSTINDTTFCGKDECVFSQASWAIVSDNPAVLDNWYKEDFWMTNKVSAVSSYSMDEIDLHTEASWMRGLMIYFLFSTISFLNFDDQVETGWYIESRGTPAKRPSRQMVPIDFTKKARLYAVVFNVPTIFQLDDSLFQGGYCASHHSRVSFVRSNSAYQPAKCNERNFEQLARRIQAGESTKCDSCGLMKDTYGTIKTCSEHPWVVIHPFFKGLGLWECVEDEVCGRVPQYLSDLY